MRIAERESERSSFIVRDDVWTRGHLFVGEEMESESSGRGDGE